MKLSIITINRNRAEGLKRTLDSVKAQTCQEFEHVIIDGASTDDSVKIIEKYVRDVSCMKNDVSWVSEPDAGIYNAMNKGLKMAHGEYTLMLNSGDYLVDEYVIEKIIPELDGTDIIQGNNIEEHEGRWLRNRGYGRSDLSIYDIMEGVFLHQASFCRRELFEKYGYFDESYALAADTKFFIICLGVHDASFRYIDVDVANYDMNGISAAISGPWFEKHQAEYFRLRNEMFPIKYSRYLTTNEKKVRLYDKLNKHKWIWNFTMLLAHMSNWIYGDENRGPRYEKIE